MKNVQTVLKNALGITGLLVAGFMFVTSLPDLSRYIPNFQDATASRGSNSRA